MDLRKLIKPLELCTGAVGKFAAWLTTILVIMIVLDVVLRYLFNVSHVWVTELEWHLFALIFLLGAAYTLRDDAHVRVDLFYANFAERKKAFVNIFGVLIFLIPWCLVVIRASFKYASNSFRIGETSPDAGGLPALWFIKSMMVLAFVLLLMQAVALLLRSIEVLRGKEESIFPKVA